MYSLNGKEVLITGGSGSLGKTLVKILLKEYKPKGIRIFSRDELKQWEFRNELGNPDNVGWLLGDIRDYERVQRAMNNVDIVIHCFVPGTKIIIKNGIKNIEDIQIGDEVLTKEGDYKKVTYLHKNHVKSNIRNIKSYMTNYDLEVTNEHPILVWRPEERCPYSPRTFCTPACSSKHKKHCAMFYKNNNGAKWIDAKYVRKGDFICNPKLKDYYKTDKSLLEDLLFGYFVAEGSLGKYKDTYNQVRFSFNINETDYIEDVTSIIKKLYNKDVSIYENKEQNSCTITLCSIDIAKKFIEFGIGSHNIRVPDHLFTSKKENIIQFLKGYFRGDGCDNNGKMSTVSETLAFQLKLLFSKVGIPVSIKKYYRRGEQYKTESNPDGVRYELCISYKSNTSGIWINDNKSVRNLKCWQDDSYIYNLVRSNKEQYYEGYVYNFSVEDSETYTANGVIVHNCAAMKQVPACEYNPIEAIKTNTLGAINILNAAIDNKVNRVMNISTDKCTYPLNLYGVSKAAAEKLFLFGNVYSGLKSGTKFSCCRYGNVLGSRGSIIPLFNKLYVENNKKIPITHFDMTRFWWPLDSVARFILNNLKTMLGNEIFVPYAIKSMKVTDLVKAVFPDAELYEVGIRKGEKLHECLIAEEEMKMTIRDGNSWVIKESYYDSKNEGYALTSLNNEFWYTPEELRYVLGMK